MSAVYATRRHSMTHSVDGTVELLTCTITDVLNQEESGRVACLQVSFAGIPSLEL